MSYGPERRGAARLAVQRGPACIGDGPGWLARPRLLETMRKAVRGPLTLLTAPPGSGKSVLVRQWAGAHDTTPVASVTFQPGDDAPRIAAQLFAAAARLGADAGARIPGGIPESHHALGGAFPDALASWLEPIGEAVLVVEAIDAVRDPALSADLGRMFQCLPADVHVVMTRRSASPAWLQRLQARGAVTAIGPGDLAFTESEVQLLVRQVSGWDLTDTQLSALVARTEGWAVGVKVAAIALRGAADPDEIIDGLVGTERHIAAFLHEEVLDGLPPAVRRFLLRTSVLETLSAPLCRAVTGEPAAGVMLRYVEQSSGFIRSVHPDGDQFVHHALLRDLLRHELRRAEPGAEADLLARAAAYQLRRGEPALAAPYLVEGKEWDQLLDVLDRHGLVLYERGAAPDVLRWLDAIPIESARRRRQVAMRRAYALTMVGESKRAAQALGDIGGREMSAGEQIAADVLRATWAFNDAAPQTVMQAADAALEALDHGDPVVVPNILGMTSRQSMHVLALGSRARALWCMGDVDGCRQALRAILVEPGVYRPWRIHSLSLFALLESWNGNFRAAHRYAREASTLATRSSLLEHVGMIDTYLAMAHLTRERGDLARADGFLDKARGIAASGNRPVALAESMLERARWYLASSRPEAGLAEIRAIDASGDIPNVPVVDQRARLVEVQLVLALGDTDRAESLIGAAGDPLPSELSAVAVQTAIARRDVAAARARLDQWSSDGLTPRSRLERELWSAIVEFEEGQRRPALERAARLAADAQAQGHFRLFLDAGRPADRLLHALLQVAPTRYVRHLARATESTAAPEGRAPLGLSQREQEVVLYLPTPLSSAEIAAQLYISLNTLKTHLRTIYRKLGVRDRRDAIQRAEDLGLA